MFQHYYVAAKLVTDTHTLSHAQNDYHTPCIFAEGLWCSSTILLLSTQTQMNVKASTHIRLLSLNYHVENLPVLLLLSSLDCWFFFRRSGPSSDIQTDPSGAVSRIASAAIVNTYALHILAINFCLVYALSDTHTCIVYMSLVSVLTQNLGHGVGRACSHNKAFGLLPFPTSKRNLY